MSFNGRVTNAAIDAATSSVALLNSSCQAVVEAEVQQVLSPWYAQLDGELGAAENLVVGWRQSGFLYFQTEILKAIAIAAEGFINGQRAIDALFDRLERDFSVDGLQRLAAMIQDLVLPVEQIVAGIDAYLARLRQFEVQMAAVETQMRGTIAQVQAQETEIQAQIATINAKVLALTTQVQADRAAIAAARSARASGIEETIFGVIFAAVTGGLSLILAGIGVASIAEAQVKIDAMQLQIGEYQQSIAADHADMGADQAIVATLNSLTLSTGLVLADMDAISGALDTLRTDWTEFDGELDGVLAKLRSSTGTAELIVGQAWFDAACTEWTLVSTHVDDLLNASIATSRIQIG